MVSQTPLDGHLLLGNGFTSFLFPSGHDRCIAVETMAIEIVSPPMKKHVIFHVFVCIRVLEGNPFCLLVWIFFCRVSQILAMSS